MTSPRWLARRDRVPPVWTRYTDLVVERGEGSWIETIEGERYLDYTCGIAVTNTGHAHPRVSAAIAEQAGKIIHAQQNILYHQPGLELHERLPRTFPGLAHGDEAGPLPLELGGGGDRGGGQARQVRHAATGDHRLPRWLPRPHPRRPCRSPARA